MVYSGCVAKIPLRNKQGVIRAEALVDDEDFEHLNAKRWCLSNSGYAVRGVKYEKGVRLIFMHHEVIGRPEPPLCTDHINRDRLDNRKSNLRHVTYAENAANSNGRWSKRGSVSF